MTTFLWVETHKLRFLFPFSSKGQVDVILLDFAKAFDKDPHRRLLHKLKFYGVDGTTLAWISSFLSRKQLVLLDGLT
jgi:hypothetical protein